VPRGSAAARPGVEHAASSSLWRRFHARRPLRRCAVKLSLLAAITLLVLFPDPRHFVLLLHRLAHLDALIDPDAPQLRPLEDEVRASLDPQASAAEALAVVERVVYERLPYSWDWETWGAMEYLPTTREALDMGREDCDGRAIVAAALLRRMGYDARLVTDVVHMWVRTPEVEMMSPSGFAVTLEVPADGAPARVDPSSAATNLTRGLAYGVSVFPLERELVILAAVVLLTLHPWITRRRAAVGVGLLVVGLAVLRAAGAAAVSGPQAGNPLLMFAVLSSMGSATAGWCVLAFKAGARPRRCSPEPPGSPAARAASRG
ncbi:MAG TPA: transglutaminase domain-containing protein, partial [Phycisphaerae bacterium]|nr:transglutaminase domain-containing protein [Phycisphaerae bacterium]